MTGKRISFALAAATLLFVGAGCAANQQLTTDTSLDVGKQERPEGMRADAGINVNAAAKVEVPSTVDASVDAIIKDGSDETDAQKDVENDAADLGSDNDSAKAFGTASYDTDTK